MSSAEKARSQSVPARNYTSTVQIDIGDLTCNNMFFFNKKIMTCGIKDRLSKT